MNVACELLARAPAEVEIIERKDAAAHAARGGGAGQLPRERALAAALQAGYADQRRPVLSASARRGEHVVQRRGDDLRGVAGLRASIAAHDDDTREP